MWSQTSTLAECSSRLIQPRGLKCHTDLTTLYVEGRGLYSLVDWNKNRRRDDRTIYCRGLYSLVDWNGEQHQGCSGAEWSRLIQPRGLKYMDIQFPHCCLCRGLYSLVDWNKKITDIGKGNPVEAYTASWIEIALTLFVIAGLLCRGLYSLVDWNAFFIFRILCSTMSRLIQPRGLKYLRNERTYYRKRRGLYSLVDWNIFSYRL